MNKEILKEKINNVINTLKSKGKLAYNYSKSKAGDAYIILKHCSNKLITELIIRKDNFLSKYYKGETRLNKIIDYLSCLKGEILIGLFGLKLSIISGYHKIGKFLSKCQNKITTFIHQRIEKNINVKNGVQKGNIK